MCFDNYTKDLYSSGYLIFFPDLKKKFHGFKQQKNKIKLEVINFLKKYNNIENIL